MTNVKVGECTITIDGVDVGHTVGGLSVTYEPSFHDIVVDKYGTETVADRQLIGEKFYATFAIAEYTEANIRNAIAAGESTTTGKTGIGSNSGMRMSSKAVELVLHPKANAASDRSEDIVMWKAVSTDAVEIPHRVDETKLMEVTFHAQVDETQADGFYLGLIGDSAAA